MGESVKLGFHYHIPAYTNENGQIVTPGYFGRFLDSIAAECDSLVCFLHSPRKDELAYMDYALRSQNITLVDIGPHMSVPKRTLLARRIMAPVRNHRIYLDAMLVRGPSPLLPAMVQAAGSLPTSLLLVGDYVAGVDDLPQPRWRKELIRLWSYWNQCQQLKAAKRSLTFVNSHKLYEELRPHVKNLHETRTTTLAKDDFFYREDTCQARPVRLLYTGRMDRAKGILHVIEAVHQLIQRGEDIVFDLVGWPQKGDPILDEVKELARRYGVEDRVVYHGFKPVGPELFQYYKNADIYALASTSSEGFPRTIWEAMAHSLPVVATQVGSIPLFLEDQRTVILVEPRNSLALTAAISRVIRDPSMRKKLIRAGSKLARQNTLETRAAELIGQIEQWVKKSVHPTDNAQVTGND